MQDIFSLPLQVCVSLKEPCSGAFTTAADLVVHQGHQRMSQLHT